ncbi:MAG: Glu/Leu/Phe/Val dehydrogenase dimerization domain-containing protein, partial [Rhodospirillales bacterium]
MFSHPDFDGHERVVYVNDAGAGLNAIIAIHSTALGPAFGGCRMWPYAGDAEALTDALRLSRGMTYKLAICGLPLGGGKSVILGDPKRAKTRDLLRAMGRAVESLGGRYIIADDVGTTLDDLAVMRAETRHTAAATAAAKAPLPVTAWGVFNALRAGARHAFGRDDLKGLTVAVQGLGHVGYPLCRFLHEQGARLAVSDLDAARVRRAAAEFGAVPVEAGAIYDAGAEIFAPCALGGVLNDATIPRLKARLVCGGANNQLAEGRHGAALAARGICYLPDYLANAGGAIDFHQESVDDSPAAVMKAVERIGAIAAGV